MKIPVLLCVLWCHCTIIAELTFRNSIEFSSVAVKKLIFVSQGNLTIVVGKQYKMPDYTGFLDLVG